MKRLRGEDGINRGVADWDPLGTPTQYLRVGAQSDEAAAHLRVRLHRQHSGKSRHKKARQLAGTRAEIEHSSRGREARRGYGLGWISRPASLVSLVPMFWHVIPQHRNLLSVEEGFERAEGTARAVRGGMPIRRTPIRPAIERPPRPSL